MHSVKPVLVESQNFSEVIFLIHRFPEFSFLSDFGNK